MMLTPLPAEEWDDRTRAALESVVPPERRHPESVGNALATLARHPDLAARFLPFSTYVMEDSTLPARLRELVILRVAHHHGCAYEWVHHRAIGRAAGLSDADVEAARTGSAADAFDRLVLSAVDEMHHGSQISAPTWEALGLRLDERARMDLIFTAGAYGVMATALNTFGVEPESWAGRPEFYENG
ncbi:carboxymuconolactone decarboxylase [Mycobacterium sp. IS-1742]|uniref:carboxymuconolactone decarboxylase family protein n=1 Tax=Mycobacterium sp. IS-1742 TaxID=1772285 RepID=UPI0007401A9A|nr:carboxymuconolactone decarboxylase family protein [Mycobacterium sp. IS-1742]KUI28697.1 carboxymuconolactone decarboxylase [Mycobacterium sp. IS-1742]